MSLVLSGTNGLSDVDGTAATPAIRGTDANTGIFFPAADTIAFSEGGAEAMRIDSSGNVGIGTSSPATRLQVSRNTAGEVARFVGSTDALGELKLSSIDNTGSGRAWGLDIASSFGEYRWSINGTERARIDSSGNLLVGTTSSLFTTTKLQVTSSTTQTVGIQQTGGAANACVTSWNTATSGTIYHISFADTANGFVRGSITTNGTGTTYGTASDYRLKENIQPMTGALDKVALLKPVTYKWNTDGSDGEGFIAHELQAVVPQCVTGEKDSVDAEGNPVYQGIDTSFLVATLTAAIQEQQALITTLTDRITALEAK
jgi:hypothetical protein